MRLIRLPGGKKELVGSLADFPTESASINLKSKPNCGSARLPISTLTLLGQPLTVNLAPTAGILRVAKDGSVYDTSGNLVKRFGFHNLRHSLSTALITGEKEDLRTVQDMMRHSNSSATLELYTQSTMSQRVRAGDKGSHFRRLGPEPVIHRRKPPLARTR